MKIFIPSTTACALLFLLAACGGADKGVDYQTYFENSLDAQFPAGTRQLAGVDSANTWVIAVFQVPKAELGGFIAANGFKTLPQMPRLTGLSSLKNPYRQLPPLENLTGKPGRGCIGLVDKTTGLLWCQMYYSDAGNDHSF